MRDDDAVESSKRALGFVIYIFVSSFDDGLDEDDDVLPPPPLPPLTLLLILRMFSAVEFLTFFDCFY